MYGHEVLKSDLKGLAARSTPGVVFFYSRPTLAWGRHVIWHVRTRKHL